MKKTKLKIKKRTLFYLLEILLFILIISLTVFGMHNFYERTQEEGLQNTKRAIEKASILCYALEGFYPPGLDYIENYYGVEINQDAYIVYYEVFARNVMPKIVVALKTS